MGRRHHENDDLPYKVELWTMTRDKVERVLGEAASAALAQVFVPGGAEDGLGQRRACGLAEHPLHLVARHGPELDLVGQLACAVGGGSDRHDVCVVFFGVDHRAMVNAAGRSTG